MARLIANLDRLRAETGMAVVLLHHGSKSGAGGPRGHSSLLGAADTVIEHAKRADGSRTATVRLARDEEPGLTLRYWLRPIDLPPSEYDRPRTAIISEDREPTPKADYVQLALDRLREAVATADGGRVEMETWRASFYAAVPELAAANRRQQFWRARSKLVADGPVLISGDKAWLA